MQRTVEVNLSLLHYMAEHGELMLVFLPNGGVWVGEQTELDDLQLFIKEADQKVIDQWDRLRQQVEATKAAGGKPLVFEDDDAVIVAIDAMKQKEVN
jgi:hypothetical protein